MKGFSLLEIMVVVAIVGIMASSVVIGFNSFGETVRTKETAGVITDLIKRLELEMIRRDYTKQTVHFEEDYLAVEAHVEGEVSDTSFSLKWLGTGGSCSPDEEVLEIENKQPTPVYLAKRDQYGNNLEIQPISPGPPEYECVDFLNSEETEWQYQVFSGSQGSQIIRFLHFNIRRDSGNQPALNSNNYTLEISAPYASKEIYDGATLETGPVTLTLQNGGDPEIITLQE